MARKLCVAIALAVAVLAAAAALPAASAQAADTEVLIDQFTFTPQRITVKAGTTVTWSNEDDVPHTIASSSKLFKSRRSIRGTSSRSRSPRPALMSISALCIPT